MKDKKETRFPGLSIADGQPLGRRGGTSFLRKLVLFKNKRENGKL